MTAPTPDQTSQWAAEGWRYYVPAANVLTTTKREAESHAKGARIYALVKPDKTVVRAASRKTDRHDDDPGHCDRCGDHMSACQCDFGWNAHYEGWGAKLHMEGESAKTRRKRRGKAGNPDAKATVVALLAKTTPRAFARKRTSQVPAALKPLHREMMTWLWDGDERTHRTDKEAVQAALNALYPAPKAKGTGNCPKCGGTGHVRAFAHIQGGACFQCAGTGNIKARNPQDDGITVEWLSPTTVYARSFIKGEPVGHARADVMDLDWFAAQRYAAFRQCTQDIAALREQHPKMRSATKGLMARMLGVEKKHRQQGIAFALYQALMAAAFAKHGPFFFIADSCGEGVSYDAKFLWKSLWRRYPSQGWVLALPSKKAVYASTRRNPTRAELGWKRNKGGMLYRIANKKLYVIRGSWAPVGSVWRVMVYEKKGKPPRNYGSTTETEEGARRRADAQIRVEGSAPKRRKRSNPAPQDDLFGGFSQRPVKARKKPKASTKASKPAKAAPERVQRPGDTNLCDPGPLIKERTALGPVSDAALPDHSIAETTWRVVDLSKLLWSNEWGDGATINAYPKAYQPRDRRRPSYREQHRDIVNYFNPEILMWAASAQQGAPIVVDDPSLAKGRLIVASGNGRTMALAEIYLRKKQHGEGSGPTWPGKQKAYKDELKRWADLLGVEVPSNVKHPVLVRVLDSSVDGPHFARLANETLIAELNATEQAIKDANKMPFEVADLYIPIFPKKDKKTGEINYKEVEIGGAKNKPFVDAFITTVAGEGARNELMTVTPQGKPKLADTGIQRIEYALFRFAYGPAVDDVLMYLTEQDVPTATSLMRGLLRSSPYWIAFEREVREGRMEAKYDLRELLVSAVLRAMRTKEEHKTTPIESAWQYDVYAGDRDIDNIEAYWMRAFYRAIPGKISNASLADVCREYCAEAISISSPAALDSNENFDLFAAVGEVKERAAVAAKLPPPEFLAHTIATALFNVPFAPRFTKAGKVVRDVEEKLMPKSLADVGRAAGETFWEICRFWDTQWQGWLIDWATAVKGSKKRVTFAAAYKESRRRFQIGVRPNQRQENVKAFGRFVKGNAAYASADKAWKVSLS